MIEVDNRINYIRSVFADKVSMFQEIDDEHDFIQFGTEPSAFIWDLTTNKGVETLY
jgi:hypothetical protein